jgi:hypothetical protein
LLVTKKTSETLGVVPLSLKVFVLVAVSDQVEE